MARNIFTPSPDLVDRGGYYLLLGILGFVLITIDSNTALFTSGRAFLKDIGNYVFIGSHETRQLIRSHYLIMQDQSTLVDSIKQLEHSNDALKTRVTQLSSLKRENEQLRAYLQLHSQQGSALQLAEVIGIPSSPANIWLMINLGSDDGVQVGQQVITPVGVVGQISEVYAEASKVLAIVDRSHALPIQLLENSTHLLAQGQGSNELVVDSVDSVLRVTVNQQVITSGLGGIYEKGLPVGMVSDIVFDYERGVKNIYITPYENMERLSYVFVVRTAETNAKN